MTNFFKSVCSALAIAAFLLMAWATSYDKDWVRPDFESIVVNTSDSCHIQGLALMHKPRRDAVQLDSVPLPFTILRSDSIFITFDSLDYKALRYTCLCPGNVSLLREVDISTADWFRFEIGCD